MKVNLYGKQITPDLKQFPVDFISFELSKENALLSAALADHVWKSTCQRVGVLHNSELDMVFHKVHDYHLDYIQLQGKESPEYCRELQTLWSVSSMRKAKLIKYFEINSSADLEEVAAYAPYCALFIFRCAPENWNCLKDYQGIIPFLLEVEPEVSLKKVQRLNCPQLQGISLPYQSTEQLETILTEVNQ